LNEKTGVVMKGSIRAFIGFLIAFGAVGTLDFDPSASLLVQTGIACLGLAVMYSGVCAMKGIK
jgi:hypothetical protein